MPGHAVVAMSQQGPARSRHSAAAHDERGPLRIARRGVQARVLRTTPANGAGQRGGSEGSGGEGAQEQLRQLRRLCSRCCSRSLMATLLCPPSTAAERPPPSTTMTCSTTAQSARPVAGHRSCAMQHAAARPNASPRCALLVNCHLHTRSRRDPLGQLNSTSVRIPVPKYCT